MIQSPHVVLCSSASSEAIARHELASDPISLSVKVLKLSFSGLRLSNTCDFIHLFIQIIESCPITHTLLMLWITFSKVHTNVPAEGLSSIQSKSIGLSPHKDVVSRVRLQFCIFDFTGMIVQHLLQPCFSIKWHGSKPYMNRYICDCFKN